MWRLLGRSRQFQQQLDARWHRLYRVAYSWCHDPHLASDLAQETLYKALKNRHQLKDESAFDAWVFTILNNCWKDHWRNQRDTMEIEADGLQTEDNCYAEIEQDTIINVVRNAIALLPIKQRQILTLIDLEEMSYKEVAGILDIPIGTVMSRICRAREALKVSLLDLEQSKPSLRRVK